MFAAATNNMPMVIVFVVIMVVMMYFSMVRAPKKQQERRQSMMNGLKKGDTIVTVGGLYGTIDSVDNAKGTIVLDSNGVFLTFSAQAIGRVEKKQADAAPAATTEASEAPEAKDTDTDSEDK